MTNFIDEGKPGGLTHISEAVNELVKNITFCPVCEYPLRETPCQICIANDREKKKAIEMERDRNIQRLGGLKAYNQFTLEKYTNKAAVDKCADYPNINIFLCGPAGTGKTHRAYLWAYAPGSFEDLRAVMILPPFFGLLS